MICEKVVDVQDLSTILDLQKCCFQKPAELHNDFTMPPLIQSLDSIENDFKKGTRFYTYKIEGEIVGSARGVLNDEKVCSVGRVVVNEHYRNKGIAKKLMAAVEAEFSDCIGYEIFTGEKSVEVVSLYQKLGYEITHSVPVDGYSIVVMYKKNS